MFDDRKHTETVKLSLTEREFVETCRLAGRIDKSPAEYIRYVLRLSLFGSVGAVKGDSNQNSSADE